jgi:hypothetical protein
MPILRLSLLYTVLVVAVSPAQQSQPRFNDRPDAKIATYSQEFTVTPTGVTQGFIFATHLPMTAAGRQKLLGVRYSVPPQGEVAKANRLYAVYTGTNLRAPIKVRLEVDVEIYRYDLSTARQTDLTPDERRKYLANEKYLEKDDPSIQAAAKQIQAGSDLETVQAVQAFVEKNMRHTGNRPKEQGAVNALALGEGKCSEFSDVFVALCRAKGIPARTCDGFLAVPVRPGNTGLHQWAEVFLKDYGWVPFDPLHIAGGSNQFGRSQNKYIYCSRGERIDPAVPGIYSYRSMGSQLKVDHVFTLLGQTALSLPSLAVPYKPVNVTDLDKVVEKLAAAKSAKPETPKAAPKSRSPVDDDKTAARKLAMAKQLAESGKLEKARQRFQEIIDKYPSSDAAKEAHELLANLKE